jgi:hypothetical protein
MNKTRRDKIRRRIKRLREKVQTSKAVGTVRVAPLTVTLELPADLNLFGAAYEAGLQIKHVCPAFDPDCQLNGGREW